MINYEQKEEYIRVKWHKKELGRIYNDSGLWVYRPRGCQGKIESERFMQLTDLKKHLEGRE